MTKELAVSTLAGDYGTPAAAYSVRKVRTAYSGALMDVRRSIDNVTSSIGYVSNGDLDTGSLLDFVVPGRSTLPGNYSGLAAAYSLRRVSGSYTGSAIDVRRIWDNTTSSIGFDSNGNLNTGSLLNFTTSGSNILPYSNDFTQADWTKYDVQITASAVLGPYGLGSGSFINETPASGSHNFDENFNPVNTSSLHTISCFVKKQERQYVGLGFAYNAGSSNYITFDLNTTSSVASSSIGPGYSIISSSINYVTDGWFRISLTGTTGISDFYPRFHINTTPTAAPNTYLGEPGTGSYVYGFQYTTGSTVQPYIPTNGTALFNVGNTSSFGYVTQWYDQSGNARHATQTATGSQPLIVSSGSLVTENGKPAIRFTTDHVLPTPLAGNTALPFNVFAAVRVETVGPIGTWYLGFTGTDLAKYMVKQRSVANGGIQASLLTGSNISVGGVQSFTTNTSSMYLHSSLYNTPTMSMFIDNTLIGTSSLTDGNYFATQNITIGSGRAAFRGNFKYSELLIYTSDQSTNRTFIENNINTYYNVYTSSNAGYVARWYDQSGNNRHATQTTTGSQPLIVLSGSIITESTSSKPVLRFDGLNTKFTLASNISLSAGSSFTSFHVEKKPTSSAVGIWLTNGTSNAPITPVDYSDSNIYLTAKLNASTADYISVNSGVSKYNLLTGLSLNSTLLSNIRKNGIQLTGYTSASENNNNTLTTLGARGVAVSNTDTQEFLLYSSDLTTNTLAIEYGINSYYNIYPQTSSFTTSSFAIYATTSSISASINNELQSGIASSGPLGFITVSRTGSNSLTLARNGVTSSFAVPASGALSTNLYLGAINNNGLALGSSPYNISFASVGVGLTNNETTALYNLVGVLNLNLRKIASDADAYNFLSTASVSGIAEQIAVNTLVTDLKSYGIWDKMKAIYPMVGGTANTHKFNLKDPRDTNDAFRLQFFGTWTHSSTGANPSGTSGTYADTFIIPNTDLINRNIHLSYYARAGSTTAEIGLFGNLTIRYNLYAGNKVYASLGSTYNDAIIGSQLVFHTVTSIDNSSNGQRAYSNGVLKSSVTNNSSGLGSTSLKLANDGGNSYRSIFECALASVGSGLTESEAANFYTAVQRFQTTLGRQV
jgi:hypothetical protein